MSRPRPAPVGGVDKIPGDAVLTPGRARQQFLPPRPVPGSAFVLEPQPGQLEIAIAGRHYRVAMGAQQMVKVAFDLLRAALAS